MDYLTENIWKMFYTSILGSVHRNSILIRSNKMQQYAGIYLLQNHSLHVSGVRRNLPPPWPLATGHWPRWRKFVAQIDILLVLIYLSTAIG